MLLRLLVAVIAVLEWVESTTGDVVDLWLAVSGHSSMKQLENLSNKSTTLPSRLLA